MAIHRSLAVSGETLLRFEDATWTEAGIKRQSERLAESGERPLGRIGLSCFARLKSKVGEITMDNELLYAKIAALEGKRPLAHRRSRR